MLVDLDHLLANPIFQADRCSLGFHFLHSIYAIAFYIFLVVLAKPYRIIGIGLLFHMLTDLLDCLFMFGKCNTCFLEAPAYDILHYLSNLF